MPLINNQSSEFFRFSEELETLTEDIKTRHCQRDWFDQKTDT